MLFRHAPASGRAALAATVAATFLVLPAHEALAEKWDMPMAYSATNFHSAVGAQFASCVTTGTNKEIEITTHPGGALIGGASIFRAIQTGQVPIGERLISAQQNQNALFGIDNLPFLTASFEDAEKLWEVTRPVHEKLLKEMGLVLLYSAPWPPQGFYFKKEVNSVADMEGVKFRSYNASISRLATLAKMRPVQIEAAEISQAFATGVADGMVSSGSTGYDRKVWESLTHFYEVDAWQPRNHVMVNADVWEKVSPANKRVIRGCAALAEYAGFWRSKEYTNFTLKGLADNGMKVQRAGAKLVNDLKGIGETMTREWLEKVGDEGKAVLDKFQAMRK